MSVLLEEERRQGSVVGRKCWAVVAGHDEYEEAYKIINVTKIEEATVKKSKLEEAIGSTCATINPKKRL